MKALKGKIQTQWLVVLIVVIAAIAIYRVGFHIPVPAFDEKAFKSPEQNSSEAQTKPAVSSEPMVQPPQTVDLKPEQLKGRRIAFTGNAFVQGVLTAILARLGRRDEAAASLRELEGQLPVATADALREMYGKWNVRGALLDELIAAMREAGLEGSG